MAYKLSAVYVFVPPNELIYVPIFHPFGNQRKPVFAHRHPEEG